ncbi:hypothetical protein AGMMS49990_00360 [Endomicrobiia bacterium]|nr:hypothetical protein AGMMS49990_00360 [Endomicrobiia bacterium]
MLYGLALQNNAPQIFKKITKSCTSKLFFPRWSDAFKIIMNFVVVCAIVNWVLITMSHMKFKQQKILEQHQTLFPVPFYPYTDYITLAFYIFVLVTMTLPQIGMAKQVIVAPI